MTLTQPQKVTPLECGLTHPHGGPCAPGPYPVRPGDPRCDAVVYLSAQLTSPCLLALGHAGECDPDPALPRRPVAPLRATVTPPDPAVPAPGEPTPEPAPAPAPDAPPADTPAPAPEEDTPGGVPTEPAADDDDDPDAQAGDPVDDPEADPFAGGHP